MLNLKSKQMKSLKISLFAIFLFIGIIANSQTTTVENVLDIKSTKSTGAIIENQKLVGYYAFFFKEKVDKKNSTYQINLYDDNYTLKKSFEITRPKNSIMFENVYNGTCFLLGFFDYKTGLEYSTYDKTGKLLGTLSIPKKQISKYEMMQLNSTLTSKSENNTIFPLGNTGFIKQTLVKNKKVGYQITAFDNQMKKIWEFASESQSKMIEAADVIEVNEKFILLNLLKKKNIFTKQMEMSAVLLDGTNGKKITNIDLGDVKKGQKNILNATLVENNVLIIGEFYKPGDSYIKDKSQGLFLQKVDLTGKTILMKNVKWIGEVDKFKLGNLDEEDKKEGMKSYNIYFHDVIVSQNGHIFLIGEQFKKQVSALGIASQALNSGSGSSNAAAAFEIRVANMVVIEFDDKFTLTDYDVISKKKTSVYLPQGAGLWSSTKLGHYVKSIGGFDYSFTSSNKEKDIYSIVFIDANRKEENSKKKSDMMLGIITIKEGKHTASRNPINTEAKTWWIDVAKPGYIAIGEYFRKEKKLNYRLEKLAY